MLKPLSLFIDPNDTTWSLQYGYEIKEQLPTPPETPTVHDHILLRTTGTGQLYAAAPGKISVMPIGAWGSDPTQCFVAQKITSLPKAVNIYLSLSNIIELDPVFRVKAKEIGSIEGFAYLNIETKSLLDLAELLDKAVVPKGGLTRQQVIDHLVRGLLDVKVDTGHPLGKASRYGADPFRQVKFAILSKDGPIDPALVYNWMRNFVKDGQSKIDKLIKLIPVRWPLIDPSVDINTAIEKTKHITFPFATLESFRKDRKLSDLQWREIGDYQKALYIHRLRNRYGHGAPGRNDPSFEFNDADWKNIFQLEAVVEFFANYNDPWKPGAVPQNKVPPLTGTAAKVSGTWIDLDGSPNLTNVIPNHHFIYLSADKKRSVRKYRIVKVNAAGHRIRVDQAPYVTNRGAWKIELYKPVNFLSLSGLSATVVGSKVTLNGNPDLTCIKTNKPIPSGNSLYDTIELQNDTKKTTKLYRIMEVDPDSYTVTVDGSPTLTGGISKWRIHHRPLLVLIDPFGFRDLLTGIKAIVSDTSKPQEVFLEDAPMDELKWVSSNFDTIYFPSDKSIPTHTYRIKKIVHSKRTVEVYGKPSFDEGDSLWHIPAGISGNLPAMYYRMGRNHWDGIMFIVHDNRVRFRVRCSSYTSKNYSPTDPKKRHWLSSIRGNREYDFYSFDGRSDSLNYCFRVDDALINQYYDGVREARFYFSTPVKKDIAPPGTNPGPGETLGLETSGKTGIRIHWSDKDILRSAGCLVSPHYHALLNKLIEIYQAEYKAFFSGATDLQVNRLRFLTHRQAEDLYRRSGVKLKDWTDKIAGTLWLIRPDERPLP